MRGESSWRKGARHLAHTVRAEGEPQVGTAIRGLQKTALEASIEYRRRRRSEAPTASVTRSPCAGRGSLTPTARVRDERSQRRAIVPLIEIKSRRSTCGGIRHAATFQQPLQQHDTERHFLSARDQPDKTTNAPSETRSIPPATADLQGIGQHTGLSAQSESLHRWQDWGRNRAVSEPSNCRSIQCLIVISFTPTESTHRASAPGSLTASSRGFSLPRRSFGPPGRGFRRASNERPRRRPPLTHSETAPKSRRCAGNRCRQRPSVPQGRGP